MRKPRSDSKLLNLPEEKKQQILDWMVAGQSMAAVRELVNGEFGFTVSVSSLSGFWQIEAPKHFIRQRLKSHSVASELAAEARKAPTMFDAAMVDRISQFAFELSITPGADPETVKAFVMMVLKAREQDLAARRVALLEEKAKQAEKAAGVVGDTTLSDEEKQRRMRQIFGVS